MRKLPILSLALCAGLAACGGVSGYQAEWYVPQAVKTAGPIPVNVIGADGDQSGMLNSVYAAMRTYGVQPASVGGPANPAGLSLNILIGASATNALKRDGGFGYTMCKLIHHNPELLGAPAQGASGGRPVLAVLCDGDIFESLGYAPNIAAGGSTSDIDTVIGQVFPPINYGEYAAHNQG